MKGIGASIKKHQKAIGIGMVAAGGTILAAGAMSIKAFAEMGDEVAKLSRKTGISAETLSELRHVAEISGTSLEGLEKATKRMSTAIGDAQDGLTETIRDFDKLGIAVEDMEGLSPEEAFLKLGRAIAGVEDPLVRANIAQGIFGRAGMDLIPMFDEGEEAMADLRKEAHALGIVFDTEAALKAEEMTDAMHRMKEATSGVKMAIAEQLIPVLKPLIKNITETISKVSAWAKENPKLTKIIVLGVTALGFLMVALGGLLLVMPGIIALTATFGITLSAAIWPVTLAVAAIAGLIAIGVLLYKNWDKIIGWAKTLGNWFVWLGATIVDFGSNALDWVIGKFRGVLDIVNDVIGALRSAWRWMQKVLPGGDEEPEIPSYQHGISRVPRTGLAMLHKGEAVVPAGGKGSRSGTANIFIYLDSDEIGRKIGAPLMDEIVVRTGMRA